MHYEYHYGRCYIQCIVFCISHNIIVSVLCVLSTCGSCVKDSDGPLSLLHSLTVYLYEIICRPNSLHSLANLASYHT